MTVDPGPTRYQFTKYNIHPHGISNCAVLGAKRGAKSIKAPSEPCEQSIEPPSPTNTMPADSAPAIKRKSTKASSEVSPDDHRKRKRNRTTQSCLNCHTTKRMCDRKRPCSRCTQLGLTGLCVYEVDDPVRKSKFQDEKSRLQNRIAELEGVIRELKHKPHPRWTDGARDTKLLLSPARSPAASLKSPSDAEAALQPSLGDPAWADLLNWESTGSSPSTSSYSHSPISTPSPLVSASRLQESLSPGKSLPGFVLEPCHAGFTKFPSLATCLSELVCYATTVELASELRRASTVLSRSLNHCFGSPCSLSTRIHELESIVGNAVRDTMPRGVRHLTAPASPSVPAVA
ncbi:hypothetical protein B0H14DRAFT_2428561 [Mycena olivaceomarginata]|nr:hypothetical protein B0H14DRAFT_2428561 [Mycena olivaceomarginata]